MSIAFAEVVPVLCKEMPQSCRWAAFTKQTRLNLRLGRNISPSQAALGMQRACIRSAAAFWSNVSKEQSIAMKSLLKFSLFTAVILISLAVAACSGVKGVTGGTGGGGGGVRPYSIGGTVSRLGPGAS